MMDHNTSQKNTMLLSTFLRCFSQPRSTVMLSKPNIVPRQKPARAMFIFDQIPWHNDLRCSLAVSHRYTTHAFPPAEVIKRQCISIVLRGNCLFGYGSRVLIEVNL